MEHDQARAAVAALSALLALGCAAMAIAHAGVVVPLLSRLGPGGDDTVWPAVVAFTVGAVVLTFVAVGVSRARGWAWPLGLVVHALVVLGAAMPYRGLGSLVAIVVSVASLAVLLSPAGRASLLHT
ncbi:MAG: hypothetical protein GEU74_15920 [Nitriliruptorales bacterium]|nr:hypothetical protein [Nitriliruptorales bacterium]